jgi:hypothetical protein
MTAFWDIVPRSLVQAGTHFRGAYCFIALMMAAPVKHRSISMRLHSDISQKAVIVKIAAVRT